MSERRVGDADDADGERHRAGENGARESVAVAEDPSAADPPADDPTPAGVAADDAPDDEPAPERPEIDPLTVEPKRSGASAGDEATAGGVGTGDGAAGAPGDVTASDTGLRMAFWRLVIVFNLALLAVWLGVLFAVFEGRYRDGAGLIAVGVLAGGYGYWRYRRVTGDDSGGRGNGSGDGTGGGSGGG